MTNSTDFEALYLEHLPALMRTARRMTRNEADSEDLVQETLIKAFKAFDRFEKGTYFKAWLFRIMTNTFINIVRKKKNRPDQSSFEVLEFLEEGASNARVDYTELTDNFDDEVKNALEDMPENYRQVLMLNSIEEFSYKEIAKIVGIPMGTVMSRIYRARQFMQNALSHLGQAQMKRVAGET
jgi:RNA polymerase sigma-70 factor (ECF subfamily)